MGAFGGGSQSLPLAAAVSTTSASDFKFNGLNNITD